MGNDADDMMAFFRQHGDQQFCRACLVLEFKLTFRGVDSALTAVGKQAALTQFRGWCAMCGRLVLVTGLERRSARSPEERIRAFLLDHVGRFFCQACIGRLLGLNIGTVQKAVWHLRASSEVRIDATACSECGQRRRVLGRDDDSISRRRRRRRR